VLVARGVGGVERRAADTNDGRIFFDFGSSKSNCTATAFTRRERERGLDVIALPAARRSPGDEHRGFPVIAMALGLSTGGASGPRAWIFLLESWVDTHSTSGEVTDEAVRHELRHRWWTKATAGRCPTRSAVRGSASRRSWFGPREHRVSLRTAVRRHHAVRMLVADDRRARDGSRRGRVRHDGRRGGPMVAGTFEGVAGWGWVVANNRGGPHRDPMYGPLLGKDARELWERAQTAD
jgi:hypothetical protein